MMTWLAPSPSSGSTGASVSVSDSAVPSSGSAVPSSDPPSGSVTSSGSDVGATVLAEPATELYNT